MNALNGCGGTICFLRPPASVPGATPCGRLFLPNPEKGQITFRCDETNIKSPQASLLFLSFITPNYLVTTDPGLGEEVQNWFEELLNEATELGQNTRKLRDWFFNRQRAQISATKRRLELQMDTSYPFL
jgi:hypothetical protein